MASGTYTSPERVIRDGRLVAFAGEVMTMDEAIARGLVDNGNGQEPEKEPEKEPEQETEKEPEQEPEPAVKKQPARGAGKASK